MTEHMVTVPGLADYFTGARFRLSTPEELAQPLGNWREDPCDCPAFVPGDDDADIEWDLRECVPCGHNYDEHENGGGPCQGTTISPT